MTPLEALEAELCAEARALARRIGGGSMPDAATFRVEFNRSTGMPHAVDCHEERRRRIDGGSVGTRKRCDTAA